MHGRWCLVCCSLQVERFVGPHHLNDKINPYLKLRACNTGAQLGLCMHQRLFVDLLLYQTVKHVKRPHKDAATGVQCRRTMEVNAIHREIDNPPPPARSWFVVVVVVGWRLGGWGRGGGAVEEKNRGEIGGSRSPVIQ